MRKSLIIIALVFNLSCNSLFDDEKSSIHEEKEDIEIFAKELDDYPQVIQDIIITEDALIRGLNFGLTAEEIRGIEPATFTQSDEEKNLLIAEKDISEEVNLDIEYHLDSNKLHQMTLIIYTTNPQQQDKIFSLLHEFLANKFHVNLKKSTWNINDKFQLSITKVGNQQEADIELILEEF